MGWQCSTLTMWILMTLGNTYALLQIDSAHAQPLESLMSKVRRCGKYANVSSLDVTRGVETVCALFE